MSREQRSGLLPDGDECLRAVFEHAPTGMAMVDGDGLCVRANEALASIAGRTVGGLLGRPLAGLFDPPLADPGPPVAGSGAVRVAAATTRCRRPDGTSVPVDVRRAETPGGDGAPAYAIWLVHDVTARARSEDALRRSEGHFRALVEHVSDIVALVDADGRLLYASPSAERLLGHDLAEVAGAPVLDFVHPDDRGFAGESLVNTASVPGVNTPLEVRLRDRAGRYRTVELVANNRLDDPDVRAIVMTARDVSDRGSAEAALRASEARFRSVFEDSETGKALVALDGTFLRVNRRLEQILGHPAAALLETGLWRVVHPDDAAAGRAAVDRLLEGDPLQLELRFVRGDASTGWGLLSASLVESTERSEAYVVAEMIDITSSKRAERDVERYAAELERRNQDLRHFAYMASHDLKSPLAAIAGFAKLLASRDGDLDATSRRYVQAIIEGAARMEGLVDGILEYAAVRTSGPPEGTADLDVLLRDVLKDLAPRVVAAGATVEAGVLPVVRGDARQLARVLQNLVGNALKAAGDAPPRITVGATKEQGEWLVEVADNGIGIDPADHERIFEMFQQAADGRQGAGIGLALCRGVVERHGGRIWVESAPGAGARFLVALPAA